MNQTARIELWTCLANEVAEIAGPYAEARAAALSAWNNPALSMRAAAVRGQARGLDFTRLPFPAWETGREFLWLLDSVIGEDHLPEVRLQHSGDLVVVAARLVEILATSAHRPRADLD